MYKTQRCPLETNLYPISSVCRCAAQHQPGLEPGGHRLPLALAPGLPPPARQVALRVDEETLPPQPALQLRPQR